MQNKAICLRGEERKRKRKGGKRKLQNRQTQWFVLKVINGWNFARFIYTAEKKQGSGYNEKKRKKTAHQSHLQPKKLVEGRATLPANADTWPQPWNRHGRTTRSFWAGGKQAAHCSAWSLWISAEESCRFFWHATHLALFSIVLAIHFFTRTVFSRLLRHISHPLCLQFFTHATCLDYIVFVSGNHPIIPVNALPKNFFHR